MAVKVSSATCPSCGFPIVGRPGQIVSCPNCGISGRISVGVGSTFFWCLFSFISGVMMGPAVKRQLEKIS